MKLIQVIDGAAAYQIWAWKFLLTHEGGWRWSISFYPDYEHGLSEYIQNRLRMKG